MTVYLAENEACPACGHTGWSPSAVSVSHPPYTRALAPILPKAEAERLFGAELRCCDACDSSYPGVWLSEDMAGLLYSVIEGQHTFGWKRMLTSLDAGDRTRIGEIEAANHAAVEAVIGPVRRYAEVKCPFAGRYPFLPRDDGGGDAARFGRFLQSHGKRSWNVPINRSEPLVEIDTLIAEGRPVLDEGTRDVIAVASPVCWGDSCAVGGLGCAAAARLMLGVRIVDLAALQERGLQYDLIGLHDVLDHLPEPAALVRRLAQHSDALLIRTHPAGHWTSQHPFVFGDGFADLFGDLDLTAIDLSDRFQPSTDAHESSRVWLLKRGG